MDRLDRIGRRLKLHDLNIITAVVRLGSMGKAAALLNTTQPTISRSIADLEHALGVPLLDRDRRGVRATEYGRALLDCGTAMFDALKEGVRSIESLADPSVGEVRIGGSSPVVASLLPAVFGRMRRLYPGLAINVTELASVEQQYRALRDRAVDLVVGRMPHTVQDDIETEVLFQDQIHVVAGACNRWAKRRKIDLVELADEAWCLPPSDTVVGTQVADAFRKSGMEFPPKGAATGSIHLLMSLVESGPSLAILPGSILRFGARPRLLRILKVNLPIPHWPVARMTLKGRGQRAVVRLFAEQLRKAAAIKSA